MHYIERTFDGERVVLDHNTFERCLFRNCTLVNEGGPFEFRGGMRVDGNVTFDIAGGEATLGLLDFFGKAFGYVDILGTKYVRLDGQGNQGAPIGN
ncbi:hypothetical protein [Sphingomonas parapaucimobilis]|uniref:Uncharacterized protein n=1 Tax=Sphingomonas parapaucimobilis NBRC 15100 TaxID=1219049 RepID=A0A0A1W5V6_9SPHN|nr:hypothetical protein [Sphingomonas parapaucimobilis]GAM00536.1 hypothetical protein SP5_034_01100 [Sphingomonas parapaucimobilis NBRC 15100]